MRMRFTHLALSALLLTLSMNTLAGHLAYEAKVTRTAMGIPHIEAPGYRGIGYGYGYAQAEDNLCLIADEFVTLRSERAKFFGRDGSWGIRANGARAGNVDSDFFWKHLLREEDIDRIRAASDIEAVYASEGYAEGYSRYVREIKAGKHPGRHASCRDEPWVTEITTRDMYVRYYRLSLLASSSVFMAQIGSAQPPAAGGVSGSQSMPLEQMIDLMRENRDQIPFAEPLPIGSNMYALGREATRTGQSMLFVNPHFPWEGPERLWLAHMTIPGKFNMMGASLYAVPAALIGFNEHFAWSHTVSSAYRFTFYELKLNPTNPTQYFYDGELRDMQATTHTIEVKGEGSVTRTLYRTHYGPMLDSVATVNGVKLFAWENGVGYTLRDANAENDRLMNQFFRWNKAKSLDEFIELHKTVLGVPWVNTVATGPNGPAYYGDVTVVPNVPDGKVQACSAQPSGTALAQVVPGLPMLDGSRSECEWDTDEDAPAPGIFGPSNLPTLLRSDWVHNCNDSYWLTNPAQPITGYARIIGDEESARSLRTRLCMLNVLRRLDGSDQDITGDPEPKFRDTRQLQEVVLSSQVFSAQLARDDVVGSICAVGQGNSLTRNGPVDVSEACAVLGSWSTQNNLDDRGGHVWREFWRGVNSASGPIWQTGFSTADPVNTPRDLNVLNPQVQEALGVAVERVRKAGFDMDTPTRGLQFSGIHDALSEKIPVFGGEGFEGAFTIAVSHALREGGYNVTYGNSYVQTVTWDENGKPLADGFITYSQATDPASPHYADLTRAYAEKQWVRWPWTPDEIESGKIGQICLSSELPGNRACAATPAGNPGQGNGPGSNSGRAP